MIKKINCKCGNTNPSRAKEYDGCLGYEAIICAMCGRYSDHNGEHEPDEWSAQFTTYKSGFHTLHKDEIIKMRKATFVIRTTRGHYIQVSRMALKGLFAQYKETETSRAKVNFTCDIYTFESDKTRIITIGE